MSVMETTTEFQTTTVQRDRFVEVAGDRVTGIAALRSAQHYLHDAAHRETGAVSWVLHVLARQIERAARRREGRLRAEFFPDAEVLGVEIPAQVQVLAPPYGHAWVSAGADAVETVYEARPAAEDRESLYLAVESAGAATDPVLDHQAAARIASHAPTAVPRIKKWLAAAERAGRQEAEEEVEREREHRQYLQARTCSQCGQRGRGVEERDIPRDEYDVRTAGEWLEIHDGLILCDKCAHRWWVA